MSILLQDLKYGTRLLLIGTLVLAAASTVVPTFRSAVLHAQNIDTKEAAEAAVFVGDVRRANTPDGKSTEARGQYATTWQKQKDGSWKVVYDIGSTAP